MAEGAVATSPIVETWDLSKTFRSRPHDEWRTWVEAAIDAVKDCVAPPFEKTVVDGVTLTIERGEFFGIVGSNGAGKTTLLKLLSCLLFPDRGDGRVNGYDLRRQPTAVRASVGIAPAGGFLGILWQLTAWENLLFRARLAGLSAVDARARARYVLDRLEVADKAHEYSWNWSAGERQKFSLAMTFVVRTPLVLLDEPTSHLDPRVSRLIRDFVKNELNRQNGQTILMSTHYLEEADLLCDRVALLHRGRILACDAPANLKRASGLEQILELRVTHYTPQIGERVKVRCGLVEIGEQFEDVVTGQARLRPQWSDGVRDIAWLRQELASEGVDVRAIRSVEPSLDDVCFHLTREKIQ